MVGCFLFSFFKLSNCKMIRAVPIFNLGCVVQLLSWTPQSPWSLGHFHLVLHTITCMLSRRLKTLFFQTIHGHHSIQLLILIIIIFSVVHIYANHAISTTSLTMRELVGILFIDLKNYFWNQWQISLHVTHSPTTCTISL